MSLMQKVSNLTDKEWSELLIGEWTVSGVLRQVGVKSTADSRLRKVVNEAAERLQLVRPASVFRSHKEYSVEQVREAVNNAICWSDVLRALDLSPYGSNSKTVKGLVKKYGLDISHFDVKAAYRRGKDVELTIADVFVANSTAHRSTVRRLVHKHNLLPYKCVKCGLEGLWQGEELNLQLDHIDGDPSNNQLQNLRFLCPNCHSQTETFGRKKRE